MALEGKVLREKLQRLLCRSTGAQTEASYLNTARGVEQINAALDWLLMHSAFKDRRGVIYFMNDYNSYYYKVFNEIRKVKKVGVWPVGSADGKPLVTGCKARFERPFTIDMASFAINASVFLEKPFARFSRNVTNGHQESEFLKQFITQDELEPLAENCTAVYVWPTYP